MLFNSLQYLIFFTSVGIIYFLLPHKFRWVLLLISSYYFYSCVKLEYVGILMFSTLVDYIAALRMSKIKEQKKRKIWLYISIFTNLGLLCTFKYINFINESIRFFFNQFNLLYDVPNLNFIWPIGISFYTFQALGYTLDVYRNKTKAEKHLGIFAVYVSFFPQLLAGPIEKASEMIPQYYNQHKLNIQRIADGIRIIIWGLFKKIVIANNLSVIISSVYDNPTQHFGADVFVAVILFPFQIYCDFSGYTDIAIGCAKILGFDLTNNFKQPLFSKSISEFWGRKWHITLSRWFSENVFKTSYTYFIKTFNKIPIKLRHKIFYSISLFITITLLGIWHGSYFQFVISGIITGFTVIYEELTSKIRKRFFVYSHLDKHYYIKSLIQITITYSLFSFNSIFFRSNSVPDSLIVINHLFTFSQNNFFLQIIETFGKIWIPLISILILLFVDLIERKQSIIEFFNKKNEIIGWLFYIVIILMIIGAGNFSNVPFYYFIF